MGLRVVKVCVVKRKIKYMKKNNMLITEIKKIIQEELGISDEVTKISKEFYSEMITALRNSNDIEKTETTVIKKTPLTFHIGDIKLSCNIIYRNFLSKDYDVLYKMPYVTNGESFRVSKNLYFLFINVLAISGTINKEKAMETIQHEIEHVYQQIKMGNGFGSESMYVKLKNDMESADENRVKVSKLIYYTIKSEQEAFANGLYAYFMDLNEPYSEEKLKESETWNNYVFIKDEINELEHNNEMKSVFNEYFCEFGLTIKDVKREMGNFLHRIGKVIIKIQNDKIKQGYRF